MNTEAIQRRIGWGKRVRGAFGRAFRRGKMSHRGLSLAFPRVGKPPERFFLAFRRVGRAGGRFRVGFGRVERARGTVPGRFPVGGMGRAKSGARFRRVGTRHGRDGSPSHPPSEQEARRWRCAIPRAASRCSPRTGAESRPCGGAAQTVGG